MPKSLDGAQSEAGSCRFCSIAQDGQEFDTDAASQSSGDEINIPEEGVPAEIAWKNVNDKIKNNKQESHLLKKRIVFLESLLTANLDNLTS